MIIRLPYIKKIDALGDLEVWLVDGAYVRGHIDKGFGNAGQHYWFSYVPIDELWIDKASRPGEWQYLIVNLLAERRLMARGMGYEEALDHADREVRRERRRAADPVDVTHKTKLTPDTKKMRRRLLKMLKSGLSVWIVNGNLVRSEFDMNFTGGGHDHVYEYVPENEVWLDDEIEEGERDYALLHELHERNCMLRGWTYKKAHAESSRLEYRCRSSPDELHDALAKEGWG